MKTTYKCRIKEKKEIAAGIFDFTVECPGIAAEAQCGQFVNILCGNGTFLRRPISICDAYENDVRFIFQVKGEGTKALAENNIGDIIDMAGPLGHGFEISADKDQVIIGGGIGVFPLYMLSKKIKADVFLGFRTKDLVTMEDEFAKTAASLTVGTDDGSYGYNGYIINALKEHLKTKKSTMIYTCGPKPMLKAVKALAESEGITCQISMEERMGCGIGACLVCVCHTVHTGSDEYKRVCKDGPVFYSTEVTIDD